MFLFALKMLIGDRLKYIGIVLALSFASFIIAQQGAIFIGIMNRTFGLITDTSQPDIWVCDPAVKYIDDIMPLKDTDLYRVRSVQGVEWAETMYKGTIQATSHSGIYQTCVIIGIDNGTLIGGPPTMLQGSVTDLRVDGGIIVDEVGAKTKLSRGGTPLRIGDVLELNDNRAIVVGICSVTRQIESQPILYTTYDNATTFSPQQRKMLSFVICKTQKGENVNTVVQRIKAQTGLAAYSRQQFINLTLYYYMKNTGIFVNFGGAIILGFVIGIVISGQTFYNFTLDNIRYFGTLKAMGAENSLLMKMVLIQALFVCAIGWGIGIGATALFGFITKGTEISFAMPPYLFVGSALSIFVICMGSAWFSMRTVKKTDPAIVFKG